jgi:hypothetical protein
MSVVRKKSYIKIKCCFKSNFNGGNLGAVRNLVLTSNGDHVKS